MLSGQYNFTVESGSTFSRVIDWQDGDGVGINLTAYTLEGKLKKRISDSNEVVSLTITKANQGTNPGRFTISLTAAQTAELPFKQTDAGLKDFFKLSYDIKARDGATVYRILEGLFVVSPEVTK